MEQQKSWIETIKTSGPENLKEDDDDPRWEKYIKFTKNYLK